MFATRKRTLCVMELVAFVSIVILELSTAFVLHRFPSSSSQVVFHKHEEHLIRSTTMAFLGIDGLFGDEKCQDLMDRRKSGKFAVGDELRRLRSKLDDLRQNLMWAQAAGDEERIEFLSKAIQSKESRDPDVVYRKALEALAHAKKSSFSAEDRSSAIKNATTKAAEARKYIARFQLEGLWVGNYGDQLQLVNVSYSGDTLIATKVTGDTTVPRGEISFTAELSPSNASSLDPLKFSLDGDDQTQVLRYKGKGQVAQTGYLKRKFVDGQMIIFEKHFSFLWLPTKHHVLFRRPTPEQTIHLLRDTIAREDELENMRAHVARCFEMDRTESLARFHARQGDDEPLRRISLTSELQRSTGQDVSSGLGKESSPFKFWQLGMWRKYLDRVLGDNDKKKP